MQDNTTEEKGRERNGTSFSRSELPVTFWEEGEGKEERKRRGGGRKKLKLSPASKQSETHRKEGRWGKRRERKTKAENGNSGNKTERLSQLEIKG